jgi:hypothetical protein
MASVANLFDAAIGFSAALLVAVAVQGAFQQGARASAETNDNPRRDVVSDSRAKLTRYRESQGIAEGEGQRLGVAYRLESGEVVYVPEGDADEPSR